MSEYDTILQRLISYAMIPAEDATTAEELLDGTLSRFEAFCGRNITPATVTDLYIADNPYAIYTNQPPREITSITRDGTALDLDNIDFVECRIHTKSRFIEDSVYEITYEAGLVPLPEDIATLLVTHAARRYSERNLAKKGRDVLDSDSVGDITSNYREPGLTEDEKNILKKYYPARL